MEIWKDINGYNGNYTISNQGRVKSYFFNNCLYQADNGKGYKFLYLYKNGSTKRFYVHRLVASEFIPNPENKPQVNHKDCNKSNNYVENLEWVTVIEQMHHASINNRMHSSDYQKKQTSLANSGVKSHLSKLSENDVIRIRKIKSTTLLTDRKISEMFGVNRATIGYIVTGKSWKHLL